MHHASFVKDDALNYTYVNGKGTILDLRQENKGTTEDEMVGWHH